MEIRKIRYFKYYILDKTACLPVIYERNRKKYMIGKLLFRLAIGQMLFQKQTDSKNP